MFSNLERTISITVYVTFRKDIEEDMHLALQVILLILTLSNVFVHSIGSYVLIYLFKTQRQNAQRLYIIHLSISECLMNLLESIRIILKLIISNDNQFQILERIRYYILIVSFTGVSFVFYLVMVYLTFDRLMGVALNFQYTKYWDENKARYLLLNTWLICGVIVTTVLVTYHLYGFDWESFFYKYFYLTVECLFILLALLTYGFILIKYFRSQRIVYVQPSVQQGHSPESTTTNTAMKATKHSEDGAQLRKFTRFKKSVFYIPLLLITTFLIFMTIPDVAYLLIAIIPNKPSETLSTICWISYGVSNLLDAWIYVYLQHDVRNFIKRKFKM